MGHFPALRTHSVITVKEGKDFYDMPSIRFSALKHFPICARILLPLGEFLLISVSKLFQQIYCNNEKSSYHTLLSVNLPSFDKVANNWEVIDL